METNKVAINAGWIIGIQLVKSVLGLIISMLTARFLGPSNFGVINYASSIVAFVVPIMQLGLNGVLVQEIVGEPQKEGEILGTGIVLSFISSVLCIIGVFAFAFIVNRNETETIIVCVLYSLLLIFQALEMLIYWFQAKLLSKYSSIVSLIAYFIVSVYKIFLLITNKSIYWFAVSNALDYFIIAVGLFVLYKKLGGSKLVFSFDTAKRLFGKSKYYIISNMMVTIFAQTDKIMLKFMMGDAETGYYSAAVNCACMFNFVFAAIIDSFRPLIFECKARGDAQYEKNMCRLYGIIIYLSLAQSLCISVFASLVIRIMYGAAYIPAVDPLRLIVWYTTFSYLGSVRNIWILAEGKQKYLWIINLFGALMNVILNCFLIGAMGIMGAALASLITQMFTNFVLCFIIKPIRPTAKLIIRSLEPRILIEACKKLLHGKKK